MMINHHLTVCHDHFRYEIMKSCWKFMPEERLDFSDLVKKIECLKTALRKNPLLKKRSTAYLPIYS